MKYQEFYKILEKNIEKKQNILVTVMEGPGRETAFSFRGRAGGAVPRTRYEAGRASRAG